MTDRTPTEVVRDHLGERGVHQWTEFEWAASYLVAELEAMKVEHQHLLNERDGLRHQIERQAQMILRPELS